MKKINLADVVRAKDAIQKAVALGLPDGASDVTDDTPYVQWPNGFIYAQKIYIVTSYDAVTNTIEVSAG